MTNEEIINMAFEYRKASTSNLFRLAQSLNVNVHFFNKKIKFADAYTHKPDKDAPATIFIYNFLDPSTKNYLFAHELGHAVLHLLSNYNQHSLPPSTCERFEFEANLFAKSFLTTHDILQNIHPTNLNSYLISQANIETSKQLIKVDTLIENILKVRPKFIFDSEDFYNYEVFTPLSQSLKRTIDFVDQTMIYFYRVYPEYKKFVDNAWRLNPPA